MTSIRRNSLWLLPAIAVLILLLLVALRRQNTDGRVSGRSDQAQGSGPASSREAGAPGPGDVLSGGDSGVGKSAGVREPVPATRYFLQATLTGGTGIAGSGAMRALVGPAFISADDLAEQAAWIERGMTGAGASSLEELANVREWLPAPITAGTGARVGDAQFGPVPVPNAPVYQVLAWNEETSLYYHSILSHNELARTTATEILHNADGEAVYGPGDTLLHGGPVDPVSPTGIFVRLLHDDTGVTTWIARLERVVAEEITEAETASRLLPLIQLMAPEIVNALQDAEPVFLSSDLSVENANRLAPLPPDPAVRLILSTAAGAVAPPVEVPLEAGLIKTVDLDLRELFPPGTLNSVAVNGRVVMGDSDRPLAGAMVRRLEGGPAASEVITDADGRFFVSAIPLQVPSRFEVTTISIAGERPLTPERHEFEIAPLRDIMTAEDQLTSPTEISVLWRMPAYQWLVLDWPPGSDAFKQIAPPPHYPVYILQRRSGATESWRGGRSDHFLKEGEKIAVSVTGTGEYRILAAVTPALLLESLPVTMVPGSGETETVVQLPSSGVPSARQLRLTDAGDGEPVVGAQVIVSGAARGLPPVQGATDSDGMYLLPAANRAFEITIQSTGRPPLTREIADDAPQTVEWSLPRPEPGASPYSP